MCVLLSLDLSNLIDYLYYLCILKYGFLKSLRQWFPPALFSYNSRTILTVKSPKSVGLSVFRVVQLFPLSNVRTFSSPPKETLYPLVVIPHSPLPQPLATTNLLSISTDLPLLDGSCKWNEPINVSSVFDYSVTLVVLHYEKMLMYCLYAVHHLIHECVETIYLAEEFHIFPHPISPGLC